MNGETRRVRSTTIIGIVKEGRAALGGDGQVTFDNTIMKHGSTKIRSLFDGSVIAGAELTYNARIYSGSSFRFREAFFVLAVFYVTLTLVLSLLLQLWERRLAIPGRTD